MLPQVAEADGYFDAAIRRGGLDKKAKDLFEEKSHAH